MQQTSFSFIAAILIFSSVHLSAQDGNFSFGAGTVFGDRSENYNLSFFADLQYVLIYETLSDRGYDHANLNGYLVGGFRYFSAHSEQNLLNNEPEISWYFPAGVGFIINFRKVFVGAQATYALDISKGAFDENDMDRPDMSGWLLSPRIGVELFNSFNFMLSYEHLNVNHRPLESINAGFVWEM